MYHAITTEKGNWQVPGVVNDGHFNRMPTPWRKIDVEKFWHWVSIYGFGNAQEFRQVLDLPDTEGGFRKVQIFVYHDRAMAMTPGIVKGCNWTYDPTAFEYYEIGCDHTDIEISRPANNRSGMHTYQCTKCGRQVAFDTSD
jgi:hypothetical protein